MQAVALRLPDRRGARARALLRRRVVGRLPRRRRLRPEDAAGAGGRLVLHRAPAESARRRTRGTVKVTGERVAPPQAPSTPPGSATGPPTRCARTLLAGPRARPGLRRRALDRGAGAARDGRRRHRRRGARRPGPRRPWSPTCARCRSPTALRGASAVHSIEHVPDPERALAEVARVLEPGGVAVFVTPNRLTFARARRDHRSLPRRRVRPVQLRGALRALFRDGADARAVRLGALPRARRARERASSTRCCASTRCGCGASCRARSGRTTVA